MIKKFSQNNISGFTLVEIMIAISIIIVMMAIVFAAIGTSRDKNNDNSIRQTFSLLRSEAEVSYKGFPRSYANVCTDIVTEQRLLPGTTNYKCLDGDQGYAIEIQLSTQMYYCVDTRNTGIETTSTSIGQSGTNCDGTTGSDCTCG